MAKIVMSVPMKDAKERSRALKTVVGLPGVMSVALGDQRDRIVVVGDRIDSIALTITLRKEMGFAELVSVAPVEEKKGKVAVEASVARSAQPAVWQPHGSVVQPYLDEMDDDDDDDDNGYGRYCCIM